MFYLPKAAYLIFFEINIYSKVTFFILHYQGRYIFMKTFFFYMILFKLALKICIKIFLECILMYNNCICIFSLNIILLFCLFLKFRLL